ncbi:MAG: DUF1015 domain-containing protein [Flavobacteriales bacterium]
MIEIKPFKAYLPKKEQAEFISTRPINSYSEEELDRLLKKHPESFLNIILHDEPKREMPLEKRFKKINRLFASAIEKGNFAKSSSDAFYVYKQTNQDSSYCGIIAGASTKNYREGNIKKHEHTIEKREKLFKTYLSLTGFNAEPVLLVYPNQKNITNCISEITSFPPLYSFKTDDGLVHELWEINDQKNIDIIINGFKSIPSVYIADGHHRSASSNLLAIENPNNQSTQYVMSLLMNEDEVTIFDFNRLIKNHLDLNFDQVKLALEKRFIILEESEEILSPEEKHEFTLYFDKKWLRFKLNLEKLPKEGIIEQLDPQIITDHILSPIFDIHDLKNDNRVDFEPGNKGLESLKNKVDKGQFDIAISMYPVSFAELKLIADNNLIMPPKSTYIEPKLRSGLTIYKF